MIVIMNSESFVIVEYCIQSWLLQKKKKKKLMGEVGMAVHKKV